MTLCNWTIYDTIIHSYVKLLQGNFLVLNIFLLSFLLSYRCVQGSRPILLWAVPILDLCKVLYFKTKIVTLCVWTIYDAIIQSYQYVKLLQRQYFNVKQIQANSVLSCSNLRSMQSIIFQCKTFLLSLQHVTLHAD